MKHVPVSSSTITSIGYDEGTHRLEIAFVSGSLYEYLGVPASIYKQLLAADSVGRAFDQLIKKGGYSYNQLS